MCGSVKTDLLGKRFGMLKVIEYVGIHSTRRYALWKCLCDCGNTKVIQSTHLVRGKSRSCGCFHNKWHAILTPKTRQMCPSCGIEKSVSEFANGGTYRNGTKKYNVLCRKCTSKKAKREFEQLKKEGKCLNCRSLLKIKGNYCRECMDRNSFQQWSSRRNLKIKAIKYLGGKCQDCGVDSEHVSIYDFHHTDNKKKDKNISSLLCLRINIKSLQKELDKCILLCNNCHRILHEKENWHKNHERQRKDKKQAITYLGGKCNDCGLNSEYTYIFDFHHLDSKTKENNISKMIARHRSMERIKEELDKCVLLCSNCHRIRHEKEIIEKYKEDVI